MLQGRLTASRQQHPGRKGPSLGDTSYHHSLLSPIKSDRNGTISQVADLCRQRPPHLLPRSLTPGTHSQHVPFLCPHLQIRSLLVPVAPHPSLDLGPPYLHSCCAWLSLPLNPTSLHRPHLLCSPFLHWLRLQWGARTPFQKTWQHWWGTRWAGPQLGVGCCFRSMRKLLWKRPSSQSPPWTNPSGEFTNNTKWTMKTVKQVAWTRSEAQRIIKKSYSCIPGWAPVNCSGLGPGV